MQQYQSLLLIALAGVAGALRLDRGEERAEAAAQARLQFLNSLAGKQAFDKYEKVVHREALDRDAVLKAAEQIAEVKEDFYDETGRDMDEMDNDDEPLEMTHEVEEESESDVGEQDMTASDSDDDDAVGMVAFLQMQEHEDHIDLQKVVDDADREVLEEEDKDERISAKDEELSELHNQELEIAEDEQKKADEEQEELETDESERDARYEASEKDAEEELDEVKDTEESEVEDDEEEQKKVGDAVKAEEAQAEQ